MEGDWYWGPDIQALIAAQQAAGNPLLNPVQGSTIPTTAPAQVQAQMEAGSTTPALALDPASWLSGKMDASGRISSSDWTAGIGELTQEQRDILREYLFPDAITPSDLVGYNPDEPMVGGDIYKAPLDMSQGFTVPNLGPSGLGPDYQKGMNYASPLYPQSEMDTILQAAALRQADSGGSDDFMDGLGSILSGGLTDILSNRPVGAGSASMLSKMLGDGFIGNTIANLLDPVHMANVDIDKTLRSDLGTVDTFLTVFERMADPTDTVNESLAKFGEYVPSELYKTVGPIVTAVAGAVNPGFAALSQGIQSHMQGKSSSEALTAAGIAALGSYLAHSLGGLDTGELNSAGEMVAQTAGSGRYPISAAEWDVLYGGSPFDVGSVGSDLYSGGIDLYSKMLSGAKLTPDEQAWINGPGYISPEDIADMERLQQTTSQAQRELPYKEPVPYDQVPETPTALTPEERGLLPASEAGGDVDQGWSTTGLPEAEQGPYVGPGPGAVDEGAWYENINWKDVIKGLQQLLNIYTAGGETESEPEPEQFYSWFGGGGMALDNSMMMGTKNTKDTKLSNLEAGKLGGVEFPFDPRLLQYMNQYQTNYTG